MGNDESRDEDAANTPKSPQMQQPQSASAEVNVVINNREYRMACRPGEEDHLRNLATQFDATINKLRQAFGEVGDMRLVVMAGLLMTDQLGDVNAQLRQYNRRESQLSAHHKQQIRRYEREREALQNAMKTSAERVEALAALMAAMGEEAEHGNSKTQRVGDAESIA